MQRLKIFGELYYYNLDTDIINIECIEDYTSKTERLSIQDLVQESINGVPDFTLLDEIEQEQAIQQKRSQENTKNI